MYEQFKLVMEQLLSKFDTNKTADATAATSVVSPAAAAETATASARIEP